MYLVELKYIIPELILVISALLLLIIGAFRGNNSSQLQIRLAFIPVIAAIITEVKMLGSSQHFFLNMLFSNNFTVCAKLLVLLATLVILFMSSAYYRDNKASAKCEYPVLVLFAVTGMLLMISANNLISLYMGLELQSLALYILAALDRDNLKSSEAGLKYFVLGSLASGLLLFGSSFIYGFSGSLDFDTIATVISHGLSLGILIGLVFVIVAISFKIAAVPFHMWAPDVYQGAPTIVTAFFVTAPKVAMFTLLIRILFVVFGASILQWQQIIIIVSALSMVVGAIGGLRQNNIKRLLAYSSIGHTGYILLGVVAGGIGLSAILVYLSIYLITTLGIFAIVMLAGKNYNLKVFSGIGKSHPVLGLCLAILVFSMAGIPPTAGFMAKFYVFMAAINKGFYSLAVIGLLSSVVAAFYYLRIIKIAYFDEGQGLVVGKHIELKLVAIVAAILSLVLLFYFSPLIEFASYVIDSSKLGLMGK